MGISISYDQSRLPSSCSADLDCTRFVAKITHWPDARFELQINDAASGDVSFLETKEFDSDDEFAKFVEEVFRASLN
jgi:hypothetical protein